MSLDNLPRLPEIKQLSKRVWRVLGLNPSRECLQGTNTYIIGISHRKVLLDTGEGVPEYLPLLQRALNDISPKAYISQILLSHCHHDHTGGLNDIFHSDLNDPFHPIQVSKYPLAVESQEYQYNMENFPKNIPLASLHDRQEILVDMDNTNKNQSTTLQVLHTPGHSVDHCCFWLKEERALFTADCVLGHVNVIFYDLTAYMKSLQVLEAMDPIRIYPGHGDVIENGLQRIQHILQHHRHREKQIIKIIESHGGSWTATDIADTIYGGKISLEIKHLIIFSITLHLVKLKIENRVKILDESDLDHDEYYSMMHKEWCYVDKCRL